MTRTLSVLLAVVALAGCTRAEPTRTYANPVLDRNFPDPAIIRGPDGAYYSHATQGEGRNIQVARSTDLVTWTPLPDALPIKPAWASRTQDFWAPHVSQVGARYVLHYSAKPDAALTDDKRGLCLAVATAARPEGPFVDSGRPLECGEGFRNIDPMAFQDPATGRRWLYWGSGFGPIKVRELAADGATFAPGSAAIDLVSVVKTEDPADYQRLVEGAWVIRRGGWYYLFFSGDNCCGPKAHYAALVARSRSATGPFALWRDPATGRARPVVEFNARWIAPGHNSIVRDAAGRDWILYHAVDARRSRDKPTDEVNSRRVMLIDPLTWVDGWPHVAGGPSDAPRPAPAQRVGGRR